MTDGLAKRRRAMPAWVWAATGLRRRARLALGAALAGAALAALLQHPVWRDAWYARLPLPALQRARSERPDDPVLLYWCGRRLNEQGRFAEADPLLRQAVGLDPDSPRLRDEWARALLGSGRVTPAFGQLREFAGTHPNSAPARYLLGKFYLTQNSMKRAEEELAAAVRLGARDPEAWAALAAAREGLGDLEGARRAVEAAVRLRPRHAGYRLLAASLLGRTHRAAEARRAFEAAVRLAPDWSAARREYARWLLEQGNPEDRSRAEREARRALERDPADADAQLLLGRALVQEGRFAEALPPLLEAARRKPFDPAPALALARAYRALARQPETARWERRYVERQRRAEEKRRLLDAVRVSPRNAHAHRRLARLFAGEGDVAGCVRHHAAALGQPLDAVPVMIAAANDLSASGYPRDALPLAQRAVDTAAANPAAHEALGNALLGLGHFHLAGLEYNKTASWWPHRTPILRRRLQDYLARRAANPPPAERAYREARRLERMMVGPKRFTPDVERWARRAVELEPTNANYLWYLLRVQMALRRNEEALVTADRLVELTPEDGRARAMRAVLLLEKATRPEELAAIETDLKTAVTDRNAEATARYALGLLALKREQPEAAARELRRAAQLDPSADVTFYKLFLAERMAGNDAAARQALAIFQRRQERKRRQAAALGDLAQQPNRPERYRRAIRIFEAHGLHAEAEAIRREARRRFGTRAGF